jgi:transcriptional regulator with XRE-family HTH domain
MENVAHFTQQGISAFVCSISSTFVAQIETRMEEKGISRSELADRLKKSSGRISQILNSPGNLGLKSMVETAGSVGMKVSVVAYDDDDPSNENGPIDPDVFVKCWERAGRPANLFDVEDAFASRGLGEYTYSVAQADFADFSIRTSGQVLGYGVNIPSYVGILATTLYPTAKTIETADLLSKFQIGIAPQVPNRNESWQTIWHQQKATTQVPQENEA